MTKLADLCRRMGIGQKESDYGRYAELKPDSSQVLDSIYGLGRILGQEGVVIGGSTAHPELLGYRQMRRPSADIDCVVTDDGVAVLKDNFGDDMFYSQMFNGCFLDYEGTPVGVFAFDIHGWEIGSDFMNSARTIPRGQESVTVASPEYTIAMKARRGQMNGEFRGKDRIDTANLLISPVLKNRPLPINTDKIASLAFDNVTTDYRWAAGWIEDLEMAVKNLKPEELEAFRSACDRMKSSIDTVYC